MDTEKPVPPLPKPMSKPAVMRTEPVRAKVYEVTADFEGAPMGMTPMGFTKGMTVEAGPALIDFCMDQMAAGNMKPA
jgi:hypothetical protein